MIEDKGGKTIVETRDKREQEKWSKLERNLTNKMKTIEFQEQQMIKWKWLEKN